MCLLDLPLSNFHKSGRGRFRAQCKLCRSTSRTDVGSEHYDYHKERARKYRRRYGITIEQYDDMYAAQAGKCLICDKHKILLNVDHDHATGKVRGLLCSLCNTSLGGFRDDITLLAKAIIYLGG
jgi:hypothetical protein